LSSIIENLKEAINGESNAKRKYELYAEQAIKENLPEVAKLFAAVAHAESIHVKNHLKAMSSIINEEVNPDDFVVIKEDELKANVKDTKSNLTDAISGERYEVKKMYKAFLKNAKAGEFEVVELSFQLAREAEKIHAKLYSLYLKKLEKGMSIESVDIYVCTICGNVELTEPIRNCKICDHSPRFFKKL
jgi:rubrerythrin